MSLKGVIIDAGHGGSDPGAVNGNVYEKNIALNISLYMYSLFKDANIPVYLTRESDITLSPTERVNKIQKYFGTTNDVILISNHVNAGGGVGAEVIYSLRNDSKLANKILDNLKICGANIRRSYQKKSVSNPSKDYYFILRDTANIESLIVEYGFIDTESDLAKLVNDYKCYATAVVNAVLDYKNISVSKDNYYIVKQGDTLYSIAKKYNMTVDKLKDINNLNSNLIKVNQKLLVGDNYYVVKQGDTLYSIAKKFNTTVDKLKDINNLNSNLIKVNQELIIS